MNLSGLLTGCVGAEPHNSGKPAQKHNPRKFKKCRTIRKFLFEILIETGISFEYQDF